MNTNVLVYEYFYNGGGVATADFNGDDLIDIYFVSNMGSNELYLNRGDWKFEEVGARSKVAGRPGPWKTGVSHVDINADGLMDIYLCYSGALPKDKRKNQLFINQGNNEQGIPQFSEEAERFGLASSAYSNQGYFLDYDLDGDLDMLLLNHNPESIPKLNVARTEMMFEADDPIRGLRLFENRGMKFVDVTTQSGVNGSALSYGLGLGIADVNGDYYPDFYISNDYEIPDYLYINNGDRTFSNELKERLPHVSKFSMGNNLSDINNDGWVDIYTLDMLPEDNRRQKLLMAPDNYNDFQQMLDKGFHYQYMRNMLHVANGDGTYSEIGQLSAISNTDWSWSALFADYDNDSWKDLYVTNGYRRDYTNLDFIDYMDSFVQFSGGLKREDVMDLIAEMPASNVRNYIYQNRQGAGFVNTNLPWGIHEPSNSNGAAYADLDNDGDLDLVVNNIDAPAFLYENTSKEAEDHHWLQVRLQGEKENSLGIGTTVEVITQGSRQSLIQNPYRGYLSAVSPLLHYGLGASTQVDSIIVRWPSGMTEVRTGIPANQVVTLIEADAKSRSSLDDSTSKLFNEVAPVLSLGDVPSPFLDYNRQPLLINQFSHTGLAMTKGDVNQDGFEDLLIGGSQGVAAQLYLGSETGLELQAVRSFAIDKGSHDTDVLIFDANGDGLNDLYVASGGYHDFAANDDLLQDRIYINDGMGDFYKNARALPDLKISTGAVASADFDQDGDLDLFVGGRVTPGGFPELPGAYILRNDGRGRYETFFEAFKEVGMVTDAEWTDLEGDGNLDLVIVGEWMPIAVWTWEDDAFVRRTEGLFDQSRNGWWNNVALHDFNGDGQLDIIAGNNGLNCQIKVALDEPAELYYADFDENGAVDPILCYYVQGKSYPYPTRKELLKQIVSLQSKFTSYESYADAGLEDILERKQLEKAQKLTANHFETSLFLSNADGQYELGQLPLEAQYAPVHAIEVQDFDGDGRLDLLLAGNNNRTSLKLGRFDANYGQVFRGLGDARFEYVPQYESGLQIKGEVREIVSWGENQLLFGMIGAKMIAYEW